MAMAMLQTGLRFALWRCGQAAQRGLQLVSRNFPSQNMQPGPNIVGGGGSVTCPGAKLCQGLCGNVQACPLALCDSSTRCSPFPEPLLLSRSVLCPAPVALAAVSHCVPGLHGVQGASGCGERRQ